MTTRCRSCQAEIEMRRTAKKNRWIPLDLEPGPFGNIRVDDDAIARTLTRDELVEAHAAGELLYTSHFATCPNAARHRR